MAWLDDHPPAYQQFRCPRRRTVTGQIALHTAESFADESPPDRGAENVADFIRRRGNYGSYHLLVDSDSILQLVRFSCVAYHVATHSLNETTIGVSAALQAHKWRDYDDDYVRATVSNMARAAARAARWVHQETGISIPPRDLSLSQVLNGVPGFFDHATADPDRRKDPGAHFPRDYFFERYTDFYEGREEPDEMNREEYVQLHKEAAERSTPAGRALSDAYWGILKEPILEGVGGILNQKIRLNDGRDATIWWLVEWGYVHSARTRALVTQILASGGSLSAAQLRQLAQEIADELPVELATAPIDELSRRLNS